MYQSPQTPAERRAESAALTAQFDPETTEPLTPDEIAALASLQRTVDSAWKYSRRIARTATEPQCELTKAARELIEVSPRLC